MQRQMGFEFFEDISNRLPVDVLELKYSAEEIHDLIESGAISQHWALDCILDWPTKRNTPAEWSRTFFLWFLRVAPCPPDYIQLIWGYTFSTLEEVNRLKLESEHIGTLRNYVRFECSLVDWVCISSHVMGEAPWMLDYLLRNGYRGRRSLGWCLAFSHGLHLRAEAISKRLLDAGAGLEWLFESPGTEFEEARLELNAHLRAWYASRLRCRQQCWALLGSWRHGTVLRQWMPREVAHMIARALWEHRWDQ